MGSGINTGKDAALALDKSGRGFIAYIEDELIFTRFKIAYQNFSVYIPSVRR